MANAWGCASQFKPRTELAVALVAHIDKHVADEKTNAYGQGYAQGYQDAEAELAKLRAATFDVCQKLSRAETELVVLRAAIAPVSAAEQVLDTFKTQCLRNGNWGALDAEQP